MAFIRLTHARLSFPHLWKPKAIEEGKEPKFSATFLLDPKIDKEQIENFRNAMIAAAAEKFGDNWKKVVKKFCLSDGNKKDLDKYPEYAEMIVITASSDKRPHVLNRDVAPVDDGERQAPYAGCYVNAALRVFAYSHPVGGKGISCDLKGVQFDGDGEPFGEAPLKPEEFFENTSAQGKPGEGAASGKKNNPTDPDASDSGEDIPF